MRVSFLEIIKISRPRFWIYEAGTFFVGVLAVVGSWMQLVDVDILLFGFYFFIPANILIYGINDIFDYETDRLNPKKVEYEALLVPEKHASVWLWIVLTNAPFIAYAWWRFDGHVLYAFLVFLLFATMYSAWPVRAKIRPMLDSLFSAGHYVATGVLGFYVAGGQGFPTVAVAAGIAWAAAMHAYSAVPDIKADTDAKLATIATFLGAKTTLIVCGVLYALSAVLFSTLIGWYAYVAGSVYVFLVLYSMAAKNEADLFKIYTYFPYVNTLIPMIWCVQRLITMR